jgi:exodeoxyribonuclease VII large subunit
MERTDGRQTRLNLSDPARVVERGFSVLRNRSGKAIRHPDDAPEGTELTAQLKGGRLGLRSTGKEE